MSDVSFTVVENYVREVDYEEFKADFLDPYTSIKEIMEKYDLSNASFREYRRKVLDETGLIRKPTYTNPKSSHNDYTCEYIQEKPNGFIVVKTTNRKTTYYGRYPDYSTAKMVRDKLVESNWDKRLGEILNDEYGVARVLPSLEKAKLVYDEFKDYYFNSDLKIVEIKKKMNLTARMYHYLIGMIREDYGVTNRHQKRELI